MAFIGSGKVTLPSNQDGGRTIIPYLSVLGPEVDGYMPISPDDLIPDSGTWTWTRDSAGLYHLTTVPGVGTTHFALNLNKVAFNRISNPAGASNGGDPSMPPGGAENPGGFPGNPSGGGQPHLFRGIQIEFVDIWFLLTGQALTTHSLAFWESTFAAGAAVPTPASKGGTLSPASIGTSTSANMQVVRTTLGTPYVLDATNAPNIVDYMELTVVLQGSSAYSLYGLAIGFDRCLN